MILTIQRKKASDYKAGLETRRQAVPAFTEAELVASICRDSFYEFIKEFWDTVVSEPFTPNWHVRKLCREAEKVAKLVFSGQPKKHDLVVNVSPGTTKSLIWSVFLPAWIWTKMPSAKFLGVSYAHTLAMDLSNKSRDVVKSEKYQKCFPDVNIRRDQDTKVYFKNTKGGLRYAAGVDGTVTGFHFHFIVIDDPLNPEQSASDLDLRTANRWIKGTLSSRKVDKRITVTILVMQRLHQDDPTAMFLQKKNVRHICLPAELTSNIRPKLWKKYYQDGLMDKVRLGRESLTEAKENGEYYYAGQFLQDPVPPGGGMFKVKKVKQSSSVPQRFVRMARYWDKAGTKGGGAYTVGTKMGVDEEGGIWVLDVKRFQMDSFEREKEIRTTAQEDGHQCWIGIEQEPGSGGKESAEHTVRRLRGYKVKVIKVDASTGGKVQRADPWSTQMNAGNVYVPKGAEWLNEWLEEHRYFPYSRYKDQVDSASGAFSMTYKKRVRVGGLTASGKSKLLKIMDIW